MVRVSALFGLVCSLALVLAAPAAAHTGLDSSTPADGATADGPVRTLTLRFTVPIELVGAGVQVLDDAGARVEATTNVRGAVVKVRPADPLADGRYGVTWAVRSDDAHPVEGGYAFTVTGGAAAPAAAEPAAAGDDEGRPAPVAPDQTLEGALASDPLRAIRLIDQALRAGFYVAALGGIGVLTFVIAAWDGPRREARRLTRLASRFALGALVLVVAQVVVRSARTAGGWSEAVGQIPAAVSGGYAVGIALRVAGAVLVIAGIGALRRSLCAAVVPIAGGAVDARPLDGSTAWLSARSQSAASRVGAAPAAVIGALMMISSFAFVGHAGTAEPRTVALLAVIAHVTAAALWGGGLVALVVTLMLRRRVERSPQAGLVGLVVTRFSVLATIGVVLAGLAGLALAYVRLDAVSELWSTAYGLVLLAKIAVVGLVGALGAYNHFVLVPAMRRDPQRQTMGHLRRVGLTEVVLLVVVAGLTSALVGLAG